MIEDTSMRRAIIKDLLENHNEINDIHFDALTQMDIGALFNHVEGKKVSAKMNKCASKIQR